MLMLLYTERDKYIVIIIRKHSVATVGAKPPTVRSKCARRYFCVGRDYTATSNYILCVRT